ncbi:cation:proton antiporter [Flexivirga sp. ID2601S]|uniref:Cation:proton antiporter n=1 Tax=Flexivirga aerilata TaxID=1656889 RepID=A0A849AK81_9MICO|nr:cation:proton antiporter [Flexivirga aerilata]NNG40769.1 cation:proton antiporter [Flexivirga aerilata]
MTLLLQVTASLALIVGAAQVCGRLAPRIGQPAVVGEMVAGVLLGPSLLTRFVPGVPEHVFTPSCRSALYVIAMIGLSLYMFLVGAEHEPAPMNRRTTLLPPALAAGGLVAPIVLGGAVALTLLNDERPSDVSPLLFAVFVGGALSVTAFPMLARVLQERRMVHTTFGLLASRTAAIDDAAAWCVLALLGALRLRGGAEVAILQTILPAALLVVACKFGLPKLFRSAMQRAVDNADLSDGLLASLLCLVLIVGFVTDYIGIYSVFGGFICGVFLPHVAGFQRLLHARIAQLVRVLLLPVFFAYSGLNTDVSNALEPTYLIIFGVLLVVAIIAKGAPGLLIMRAFGYSWGESKAMAGLMNARGLMILIFINLGFSMGLVDKALFATLVLIAIATTALALPIYRSHYSAEAEEEARRDWGAPTHGPELVKSTPFPAESVR